MKKIVNSVDGGFTLLEVLLALVVLSVGLLGVAQMQIASIKGNAKAGKYIDLMKTAQNQIELAMQRQYSALPDETITSGKNEDYTIPDNYTLTYTVSTVSSKYKKITVKLEHSSKPDKNPTVALTFIKARDI